MNWNKFNFHNLWIPMIFFVLGIIAGILFPHDCKPQKEYPVKIDVCYETKGYDHTGQLTDEDIENALKGLTP